MNLSSRGLGGIERTTGCAASGVASAPEPPRATRLQPESIRIEKNRMKKTEVMSGFGKQDKKRSLFPQWTWGRLGLSCIGAFYTSSFFFPVQTRFILLW